MAVNEGSWRQTARVSCRQAAARQRMSILAKQGEGDRDALSGAGRVRCRSGFKLGLVSGLNALGEAERVKGTARVADLLALQRALEAQEAARLRLAAGRPDVLPPLHLHEARKQELDEQQRRCARYMGCQCRD